MESTYQAMRTFADSWGLLYMVIIFCVVIVYALRPGAQRTVDEAANIPFKEDE
ncbi:MAG: cbb3-type cytochrome c oxidase subunit 3 [Pseudomonadota bacterium]